MSFSNIERKREYARSYQRMLRQKHPEEMRQKTREQMKRWRERNMEKARDKSRTFHKLHPEKDKIYRKRTKEKKFGVKYPDIINCEICGESISGEDINLDHNHETGKFRGWLCIKCNTGLGYYERYMESYKRYLESKK